MSETTPSAIQSPSARSAASGTGRHSHARFTIDDDSALCALVAELGEQDWAIIAGRMRVRSSRQCRERWINYLAPALNRDPWTPDEDALLLQMQAKLGNRWAKMAQAFANRTDTMVKNRFLALQRDGMAPPSTQPRIPDSICDRFCEEPLPGFAPEDFASW